MSGEGNTYHHMGTGNQQGWFQFDFPDSMGRKETKGN